MSPVRKCHSSARPCRQTTSFGVRPTPGRPVPVASLIPLRARKAVRSTSDRTRSTAECWMLSVSIRRLLPPVLGISGQLEADLAYLAVQLAELSTQPADIRAGG